MMPQSNSTLARLFPAKTQNVNYLINWSHKLKIIYVETPKVGCTTIKQVLQYSEVDGVEANIPDYVHNKKQSPLMSPSVDTEKFLHCLQGDDYLTFSFVRNPYTRILSAYLDKIVGQSGKVNHIQKEMGINPAVHTPSFEEFLDLLSNQNTVDINPHFAPQTFLLGYRSVRYDFIGRFENFNDSIAQLVSSKNLQVPPGVNERGQVHATHAGKKTHEHFTPRSIKLVQSLYYDDFRYLGYGWSL